MDKNSGSFYISPEVYILDIDINRIICASGDYDGQLESISEEDW